MQQRLLRLRQCGRCRRLHAYRYARRIQASCCGLHRHLPHDTADKAAGCQLCGPVQLRDVSFGPSVSPPNRRLVPLPALSPPSSARRPPAPARPAANGEPFAVSVIASSVKATMPASLLTAFCCDIIELAVRFPAKLCRPQEIGRGRRTQSGRRDTE